MTNYSSQFFIKRLVNQKYSYVLFNVNPETDERFISTDYDLSRYTDSVNFMGMSFVTTIEALAKDKICLQKVLIDTKNLFEDEWSINIKRPAYLFDVFKRLKKSKEP